MQWHLLFLLVGVVGLCCTGPVQAVESTPLDAAELQRFQGHWRVTELVEDGRPVSGDDIQNWLPSGGQLQFVENAILFFSRLDGKERAKTFSIDPTILPKTIVVMTRDKAAGRGIYRFEDGRLLMCLANPAIAPQPTDFSARAGSKRMLLTLEVSEPSSGQMAATKPRTQLSPVPAANPPAANPPAAKRIALPPPPPPSGITARVVTDAELISMLPGLWSLNDGVGTIQLMVSANGTFSSTRQVRNASTYHYIFVPTPVSNGTWSVKGGQLLLRITSSIHAERINRVMPLAVRSISRTDLIVVDSLGRVIRAVRAP